AGGGELTVAVVEVVDGQPDLLEVVLALDACGGLADLLDGGQQQPDEDRYDCYDHQQLDQREPGAPEKPPQDSHGSLTLETGTRIRTTAGKPHRRAYGLGTYSLNFCSSSSKAPPPMPLATIRLPFTPVCSETTTIGIVG